MNNLGWKFVTELFITCISYAGMILLKYSHIVYWNCIIIIIKIKNHMLFNESKRKGEDSNLSC